MATHTELKGFNHIGESLYSDQLEANLLAFFQWGLLGKGAFFNVALAASGAYGGDKSRLRPVKDPYFSDGQVWQAHRQDWVWETGVPYQYQPIRVSGVYVDGDFLPIDNTGTPYHIDYVHGRVIFDEAISRNTVLTAEYSHRLYHLTTADVPWWRQVHHNSFRVDDAHFAQWGSGVWAIASQNRVQLPAVVIEATPRTNRVGAEMGSSKFWVQQDVIFHILSETPWDRKQIHDAITYQQEKRIIAFDKNELLANDAFPLDHNGSPKESGVMYPDLVSDYPWRQVRMMRFTSTDWPSQVTAPLYYGQIRGTMECDV